jgi:plasmid stabilization system protein ParE
MNYEVRFRPQARRDIIAQLRYLSEKASPHIASNYLARIKTF